jgi:hypothetical protein
MYFFSSMSEYIRMTLVAERSESTSRSEGGALLLSFGAICIAPRTSIDLSFSRRKSYHSGRSYSDLGFGNTGADCRHESS